MGTVGTTAQLLLKSPPLSISSARRMIRQKLEEQKNLLFSATRTDFNENTGLTGRQSAAAFRSTAQLT